MLEREHLLGRFPVNMGQIHPKIYQEGHCHVNSDSLTEAQGTSAPNMASALPWPVKLVKYRRDRRLYVSRPGLRPISPTPKHIIQHLQSLDSVKRTKHGPLSGMSKKKRENSTHLATSGADGVSTYSHLLNARVSRPHRPPCHVSSSAHSCVSAPQSLRPQANQHAATTSAYVSRSPKRNVSDCPRASASFANGSSASRSAAQRATVGAPGGVSASSGCPKKRSRAVRK